MQFVTRYLLAILFISAVSIVSVLFESHISKTNREEMLKNLSEEHIVIRHPKAYILLGCVSIVFFGAIIITMYLFPNETTKPWVFAAFGVFLLMGNVLILDAVIFKIDIYRSKDYFLYRNIFFRTYKIYYRDCLNCERIDKDYVLETIGKKLRLDCDCVNIDFLISMLVQYEVMAIEAE